MPLLKINNLGEVVEYGFGNMGETTSSLEITPKNYDAAGIWIEESTPGCTTPYRDDIKRMISAIYTKLNILKNKLTAIQNSEDILKIPNIKNIKVVNYADMLWSYGRMFPKVVGTSADEIESDLTSLLANFDSFGGGEGFANIYLNTGLNHWLWSADLDQGYSREILRDGVWVTVKEYEYFNSMYEYNKLKYYYNLISQMVPDEPVSTIVETVMAPQVIAPEPPVEDIVPIIEPVIPIVEEIPVVIDELPVIAVLPPVAVEEAPVVVPQVATPKVEVFWDLNHPISKLIRKAI